MGDLTVIGCLVTSGVFVVSAAGKSRGPTAFSRFTEGVTLLTGLTGRAATALGVVVVVVEWLVAVLCVAPAAGPVGPLLAVATLAAFLVALARVLASGRSGSCHCLGSSRGDVGARHLVRNAVLIVVALAGAVGRAGDGRTWVQAGVPAPQVALDLVVTVVLTAAVLAWDDLASLFSRPTH